MATLLDRLIERASANKQTIVLPEGGDARTLEAAQKVAAADIANVVVLGDVEAMKASGYDLSGVELLDNRTAPQREAYAAKLYELRQAKGMTEEQAMALMDDELYFGVMMVKMGDADGMVSGACHATADVLRPALQIIKTAPGAKHVSSFFLMEVPDCEYGEDGIFVFSDCGLEISPTPAQLAQIAKASAQTWRTFLGTEPRVAMLSHSTYGSSKKDDALKVVEAVQLAKELCPDLSLDGELQLDAAIVPEIGQLKAPDSPVAGKANVLIFPDLDAGNIGYKLVQRLAKAEAYGPVTQGLAAPVNDLSRGCCADDIVGVVAITAVQAIAKKEAEQN